MPDLPQTTMQFRLRSALIACTVLAVLLAIAAPILRILTADQQSRLAIVWGTTLATFSGLTVLYGTLRRRAERLGGKLHFRLELESSRKWTTYYFASAIFWMFLLLLYSAMAVISTGNSTWILVANGFTPGMMAALVLVMTWWRFGSIEFRNNGAVTSTAFVPWVKFKRWGWQEEKDSQIILILRGPRSVKLKVPPEQQTDVDEFLCRVCPDSQTP